jgi:hypothetical protein
MEKEAANLVFARDRLIAIQNSTNFNTDASGYEWGAGVLDDLVMDGAGTCENH